MTKGSVTQISLKKVIMWNFVAYKNVAMECQEPPEISCHVQLRY